MPHSGIVEVNSIPPFFIGVTLTPGTVEFHWPEDPQGPRTFCSQVKDTTAVFTAEPPIDARKVTKKRALELRPLIDERPFVGQPVCAGSELSVVKGGYASDGSDDLIIPVGTFL